MHILFSCTDHMKQQPGHQNGPVAKGDRHEPDPTGHQSPHVDVAQARQEQADHDGQCHGDRAGLDHVVRGHPGSSCGERRQPITGSRALSPRRRWRARRSFRVNTPESGRPSRHLSRPSRSRGRPSRGRCGCRCRRRRPC